MIKTLLFLFTLCGYTFAYISVENMHEEVAKHAAEIRARKTVSIHDAYIFADLLMEKAHNPETPENIRGKYVNMAHLALMGYGFGGIREIMNSEEISVLQRVANAIGFITKQPGGLEPQLSDDEITQRHWYTLYGFINEGANALGEPGAPELKLPPEWTWDVPKTVFRPSMYYRGEIDRERNFSSNIRKVGLGSFIPEWDYYMSFEDVLRSYGIDTSAEGFRLIFKGNVFSHNYKGNYIDFMNHHGLDKADAQVIMALKVDSFSEKNTAKIKQWILNRLPEDERHAFLRFNFFRDDIKANLDLMYQMTFMSKEERADFLRHLSSLQEEIRYNAYLVTPEAKQEFLSNIVFKYRHRNLREKKVILSIFVKLARHSFDLRGINQTNLLKSDDLKLIESNLDFLVKYFLTLDDEKKEHVMSILFSDYDPGARVGGERFSYFREIHNKRFFLENLMPRYLKHDRIDHFFNRLGDFLHKMRTNATKIEGDLQTATLERLMPHFYEADHGRLTLIAQNALSPRFAEIMQGEIVRQQAEQRRVQALRVERPNPRPYTNIHHGDRDSRTRDAVIQLVETETGLGFNPSDVDIARHLDELEAFIRACPELTPDQKDKASILLTGRDTTGRENPQKLTPWGFINDNQTLAGHSLKKIYAHLWHFCKLYNTMEDGAYRNPFDREAEVNDRLKVKLAKSMAESFEINAFGHEITVCPQGKTQRAVVAVLQGTLRGVNVDGTVDILGEADRIRMAFEVLRDNVSTIAQLGYTQGFTTQEQYEEKANRHIEDMHQVITIPGELARYRDRFFQELKGYFVGSMIPRESWIHDLTQALKGKGVNAVNLNAKISQWLDTNPLRFDDPTFDHFKSSIDSYLSDADEETKAALIARINEPL